MKAPVNLVKLTGIARATAAVAPTLFPKIHKRGAKPANRVPLLSATGVSIATLFTGGLLPGVVVGLTLAALVWWRYRGEHLTGVRRASGREIGKSLLISIPALALPVAIRAAVVEGVAIATEVRTIGILYAVIAGLLVYRQFDWKRVYPMLVSTASLSRAILFMTGAVTFMAVSVVAFIVLGPLLLPIARQLGIHEVQHAVVVTLSMGTDLLAPPFPGFRPDFSDHGRRYPPNADGARVVGSAAISSTTRRSKLPSRL